MNLLPIWHTSSNNHQKFKILKKRTDLRINGELITKGDLFSHSSQSNHTNRSSAQTNKNSPTNIIYNHIKELDEDDGDDEYNDYEDDDEYTDYISLKRDFISNSTSTILDNNKHYSSSRLGPETLYSASTEQFNLIDTNQIKKIHLKNRKNNKKIDVISIPNNYHVEINSKLRKFFFNQNYSDNQNQNIKNRASPKGTKYLKYKNSYDQHLPPSSAVISHEIANTFSSSSFANSYDSDMFRYQNWIIPDLKATSLSLTKFNNNNNTR